MLIKEFREEYLKMTQSELADYLDERQDTISRLEKNQETDPDNVPFSIIKKIAERTGQTLDQVMNFNKTGTLSALEVADTWGSITELRDTIVSKLKDFSDKKEIDNMLTSFEKEAREELESFVTKEVRKPRVAFVGQSDTGKSTLINALLGKEKMPASWTPTTSISVYIKHKDDRPDFINDEVWIFKGDGENEFNPDDLVNQEKCESLKIAQGTVDELKAYGTRQGEKHEENASAAVMYIESDILHNVDLIDLPGFGTGDREHDDEATNKVFQDIDVLVYLSRSNSFMNGGDMQCLVQSIPLLPVVEKKDENKLEPLCNVFIVASQAQIVGSDFELQTIFDSASRRFERVLPDTFESFFKVRSDESGYETEKSFRSRFYSYSIENETLRKQFEEDFIRVVENLPAHISKNEKTMLEGMLAKYKEKTAKAIELYTAFAENKDEEIKKTQELETKGIAQSLKNSGARFKTLGYWTKPADEFKAVYENTLSVDTIVDIIKTKGFKKNQKDIEDLLAHISVKLQDEFVTIITKHSELYVAELSECLQDFEASLSVDETLDKYSFVHFDVRETFAGEFAERDVTGIFSLIGNTIGSSVGGAFAARQILNPRFLVGLRGIGFAAGAIATIAAPVLFGFSLAAIFGIVGFNLASSNWEKTLAKKIIKEYESMLFLTRCKHSIMSHFFGNDTIDAFSSALEAVEKKWNDEIALRKALAEDFTKAEIKESIEECKNFEVFLDDVRKAVLK